MNHPPGSYVPSALAGGLGYVFSCHSTAACGSSSWQTREAEKPVVSAGFPSWQCCVMKKHQQNQGGEQNQKDRSDQCKIENALCSYHRIRFFNEKCIFTGYVYIPGHLLMQLFPPEEKNKCIFLSALAIRAENTVS